MNGWFEWLFVGAVAVGCIYLSILLCDATLQRRRAAREGLLMRRSVSDLVRMMVGEERSIPRLSLDRAVRHRLLLGELIARLTAAVYGCDPFPLAKLLCRSKVDRALLRIAKRTRSLRRACALKLLADLPSFELVVRTVARYRDDASREVRFAVLLVETASDPHRVLQRIADYEEPLSRCEVAELLHLLRRGLLPIAYRPLLESENGNLQRLGVVLVELFAIEEADRLLLPLIASQDRELAAWSFRAYYLLHRPLRRKEVVAYVRQMDRIDRCILMRSLALAGYTESQARWLFGEKLMPRYGALVASFKRSLVCG